MNQSDVARLEAQAVARIEAGTKNPAAPGISMCTITPHDLLELCEAWRKSNMQEKSLP